MPGADETARASELDAHLEWRSAQDRDAERAGKDGPAVRGFFLGQLPDDEWADEPTDQSLERLKLRTWTARADLDSVLEDRSEHLARLVANFDADLQDPVPPPFAEEEQCRASGVEEPTLAAATPELPAGRAQSHRAAGKRAKSRRSRVAVVATVVVALVAGTGVYVGTNAKSGDQRGRRPPPPTFEQSSPTAGTSARPSDASPDTTNPAPDSDVVPGPAAPTSRPGAQQGPRSAPARVPGTNGPTGATSPTVPGSTAAPPGSASPPSAPPPRSPMCQVLPVLCP